LELAATQPLLLQGADGYSRKGPLPQQASQYYSQPQLRVQALLEREGQRRSLPGRAWLDHEWSDEYLPADAVGWDWIGINLDDGGALMAFRLRRADGSALWAGGSQRSADGRTRTFEPGDLRFMPQRWWTSAASQARYPVQWAIDTPAGRITVRALMDAPRPPHRPRLSRDDRLRQAPIDVVAVRRASTADPASPDRWCRPLERRPLLARRLRGWPPPARSAAPARGGSAPVARRRRSGACETPGRRRTCAAAAR